MNSVKNYWDWKNGKGFQIPLFLSVICIVTLFIAADLSVITAILNNAFYQPRHAPGL